MDERITKLQEEIEALKRCVDALRVMIEETQGVQ
jgi:uncharacterized small protein (DUF1192 family)